MPLDELNSLPRPGSSFASDNSAGVHPAVLEAVASVNHGHVLAYGDDEHTRRAAATVKDLFGGDAEVWFVWNGTGANVMALGSLLGPAQAVVCSDTSHIAVDETGAPERILGAKLIDLPTPDGKLRPDQLHALEHLIGVEHHAQPAVVSLTQSSELGTVYRPDEVAALCETAHRLGMSVHMDGARIANAAAALGGDVRSFTTDAGVDVVSFGATKNGIMYGEAVVYLGARGRRVAPFVRKMVTQLPSKMRYVAAQVQALLDDDLWLRNARHANTMAARLHERAEGLPGVTFDQPPEVNGLFPCLPPEAVAPLQAWCPFYTWEPARHQVRWMTAWDTTPEDVDRFAAGVRAAVTP